MNNVYQLKDSETGTAIGRPRRLSPVLMRRENSGLAGMKSKLRWFPVSHELNAAAKDKKASLAAAFEFGFKCAEKGMNLQAAMAEFNKTLNT